MSEFKIAFKKSIKDQVLQTVSVIDNPMENTPFEGIYIIKILGDVIEKFKERLSKSEHALAVFGDEYEVEKVLSEIHGEIQDALNG
ncbi:hypothetical protein [uncultured Tenacibaculum sp.]|uniref:hypothetical protein n=1 Tax=uncultured Tenacibaculum sp. TaxID=174713 RepID=UPI002623A669|nr:hypothetical protein [uncultured Tenacibaculum sp.]